jgi:hypothetical protein
MVILEILNTPNGIFGMVGVVLMVVAGAFYLFSRIQH